MEVMGEQVRFRSHNYRLSGGGASAPSGGRNPFKIDRRTLLVGVAGLAVGGALGYFAGMAGKPPAAPVAGFDDILKARGLTPDEARAALQTFVPPGRPELDEFIMIPSGGHSGQVLVIAIPSMRILKIIGVNTPEPWQEWGYGEKKSMEIFQRLKETVPPKIFFGGDTHHPDFDRRDAKYVGEWAFIGDKLGGQAAARRGIIKSAWL
jgi:nitrous-oxide reductase